MSVTPGTHTGEVVFDLAGARYGATMSTGEAARLFGCSQERLQSERGKGTLPVEPLTLGRRLRWPTVLVASALGLEAQRADPSAGDLDQSSGSA